MRTRLCPWTAGEAAGSAEDRPWSLVLTRGGQRLQREPPGWPRSGAAGSGARRRAGGGRPHRTTSGAMLKRMSSFPRRTSSSSGDSVSTASCSSLESASGRPLTLTMMSPSWMPPLPTGETRSAHSAARPRPGPGSGHGPASRSGKGGGGAGGDRFATRKREDPGRAPGLRGVRLLPSSGACAALSSLRTGDSPGTGRRPKRHSSLHLPLGTGPAGIPAATSTSRLTGELRGGTRARPRPDAHQDVRPHPPASPPLLGGGRRGPTSEKVNWEQPPARRSPC